MSDETFMVSFFSTKPAVRVTWPPSWFVMFPEVTHYTTRMRYALELDKEEADMLLSQQDVGFIGPAWRILFKALCGGGDISMLQLCETTRQGGGFATNYIPTTPEGLLEGKSQ